MLKDSLKTCVSSTRLIFLLVLILFTSADAERLPIKIFTSADGLGSSFINFMSRDSRGFIWVSTRDGLSRFDGSRFITYRIRDEMTAPAAEFLTETSDGSYWVETTDGLFHLKADAISTADSTNSEKPILNAEFISSRRGDLIEDSRGNLWFGGGGFSQIKEKDGKYELEKVKLDIPPQPGREFGVVSILEAEDGSIWANSTWGPIRLLPDGRQIIYLGISSTSRGFTSMKIDDRGRVWLNREFELTVINPEPIESLSDLGQVTLKELKPNISIPAETEKEINLSEKPGDITGFTPADFLKESPTHRLFRSADNHIWMTTDTELIEFDGHVFHLFNDSHGLPNGMYTMTEDVAGNLWVGGRTGLIRFDRKGLTSFTKVDGLHSNSIYSISEGPDGKLYFGDGDYYLNIFDGKKMQAVRPNIEPNPRAIWTSRHTFVDSRNEMWVLTSEKLYRFAANDLKRPLSTYTTTDGLKDNAVYQIYEDKRGDIWVSVQPLDAKNCGLARFNRAENKFHNFGEEDGYPNGRSVSSFVEDSSGNLWVSFYEGGVARYKNGRFTRFANEVKNLVSDLLVDKEGRLWISTATVGILRVDDPNAENPEFIPLNIKNGLSSNNIRTLVEDRFGNIYAGTVRGIDRMSADISHIKHYSINDGLASDFVTDSYCDKNGALWFATTNGLSRFVPADDEKPPVPQTWIGGLRISGVKQRVPELGAREIQIESELSHTQNNLEIDFFGMDFRAGEVLRYQYKLEGADDDWRSPSEQRTVTYGNLQPGTYRFMVRAVNSSNITSENPAVISFKILPPLWLRWWFLLLCAVLVTTIIVSFYRYRMARLREVNLALAEANRAEDELRRAREERLAELEKVRSRIATDLHDDIGASLTQIAVLSEVARQQSNKGNGALAEPLQAISSVSNELVGTMSDIVWSINPSKDHLSDLTQRMRRFASDVLSSKGIGLHFHAPGNDEEITIGTNLRREVFLIFKESVNNAVKHSGATQISIDLKISGESLNLKISDNGKGFVLPEDLTSLNGLSFIEESNDGGNGILSIQKRALEMGGKLQIISSINKGTVVSLNLPLDRNFSFNN